MGTGKWSAIGEVETVPSDTPKTGYKNTVLVSDFAQKILISKNLFDWLNTALKSSFSYAV